MRPKNEQAELRDALLAECAVITGATSDTTSGATSSTLPGFGASCADIVSTIEAYGDDEVFRHQADDLLTQAGNAPDEVTDLQSATAVIATRDEWSLCHLEIPTYAQTIVDENPQLVQPPSASAKAVRRVLASEGIHFLKDATDSAIDVLGDAICRQARPLQPLDTPEIKGISDDMAAKLGVDDPTEAAKAFFVLAVTYCPELDMSG